MKKGFAIRCNSKALQLCLWGDSCSRQAGFWSCLDTRSAVCIFFSPLESGFEYSFDLFLNTSPADTWKLRSALIWAESAYDRWDCLKEEDLLSVLKYGKLSPVWLKIDPTLRHTQRGRVQPVLFEYVHYKPPSLAPSFSPRPGYPNHSSVSRTSFSCFEMPQAVGFMSLSLATPVQRTAFLLLVSALPELKRLSEA